MDNNLRIEVYEYILNDYSPSPNIDDTEDETTHFYTTKIKSISSNECGYIGNETIRDIKNPIVDLDVRSCDVIDGTIKNIPNSSSGKPPLVIDDEFGSIAFDLGGITSDDLIKFSHEFVTKIKTKSPDTIDIVQEKITNMSKLYDIKYIEQVCKKIKDIISKDWISPRTPQLFTYIKILTPKTTDKFIILGDLHGSYSTFMRMLLRFRKLNYMNEKCVLREDCHIIFLGDMIDRGTYGFEIVMLIFLLKIQNPTNVHINNGNHEEKRISEAFNFKEQLTSLFSVISANIPGETWGDVVDIGHDVWTLIHNVFLFNHSALLIKNPNVDNKYVYLAHGGYPITSSGTIHPTFNMSNIKSNNKLFIPNLDISNTTNSIRWNDFHGMEYMEKNTYRGAWNIGSDMISELERMGIELTIRAHQDSGYNTKLILWGTEYDNFTNINDMEPFNTYTSKPQVCYGYSHLIEKINDSMHINGLPKPDFLPVVTISTNTDQGRNLIRDSYLILKFTNDINPQVQGCVEQDSVEEAELQIRIAKKTLADELSTGDYEWGKKYLKYKNKYLTLKKKLAK
jgi:hypothetical protein